MLTIILIILWVLLCKADIELRKEQERKEAEAYERELDRLEKEWEGDPYL
jgi:hypothetical protein